MIAILQGPDAWGGFLSPIAAAFLIGVGAIFLIALLIYGGVRFVFWLIDRRGTKDRIDTKQYREK